jgi:hypothetical protein
MGVIRVKSCGGTDITVDVIYRILVGPNQNRESARIAQRELERAGYKTFIRH